jgi:CCR4-NOT transcriptional regulation complex NOT5 subunit
MTYNFEYFQELESYEAQEEYNIWLDEQDDIMVRLHESEMSPEVVE